jgi:heme exporter protein B
MNGSKLIIKLLMREWKLALRSCSDLFYSLGFFIVIVSLFPMAISPDPELLKLVGPGIIWMAVLFASILSLPQLFNADFKDGNLEQYLLTVQPLSSLVIVKILVHGLFIGLPLLVLAPLLALFYQLSTQAIINLVLSLLLGIPSIYLLGAIGAAITIGLRNSALLLTFILLPLYVPILIFATSAVIHAQQSTHAEFALLGALFIFLLILAPLVTSYCLRLTAEQ